MYFQKRLQTNQFIYLLMLCLGIIVSQFIGLLSLNYKYFDISIKLQMVNLLIFDINHTKNFMKFFDADQTYSQLQIWLLMMFLVFYAVLSSFLEHKKLPIHRSAVATLIGIISGLILVLNDRKSYNILSRMSQIIIFLVLYPPMVFAEGYTFRKGAFLQNIKYSVIFGIIGSFGFYIVASGLLGVASQFDLLRDAKDITNIRNLSIWQILLLGACLCGSDVIAGQQEVSHTKYPKLNAIIKGEGLFKDCVTIVMFRAVLRLQQSQTPNQFTFYWYTPLQIVLNFIILIVGSSILGSIFGYGTSFMFKKWRFLSKDEGITETSIMFLLGFALYVLSEMVSLSGVISILCFGVILNRYNIYNLSLNGKITSKNTFTFVSNISQALLFLLMGAMIWQTQWQSESSSQMSHSWSFTLITICIIFFARFINIYLFALISKLFSNKFMMNRYELFVLFMVGIPKGATTFALFTSVQLYSDNSSYAHNEGLVIKSTLITVIILSCMVFNSLVSLILKKPLQKLGGAQIKKYLLADNEKMGSHQSSNHHQSNQNMKKVDIIEQKIKENVMKARSKLRIFDEETVKPLFIYRYNERKQEILHEKILRKRQSQEEMFKALAEQIPNNQQQPEPSQSEPTLQ